MDYVAVTPLRRFFIQWKVKIVLVSGLVWLRDDLWGKFEVGAANTQVKRIDSFVSPQNLMIVGRLSLLVLALAAD